MKKILSFALACVFLLGSAAVAIAQESPSPAAKTPQERAGKIRERGLGAAKQGAARARGLRVLHTDGVGMKADGSTVAFRTQKGIIKAVSATSITIESADHFTGTYKIDGDTVVREKGQTSEVGDLKAGEMANVHAVKSGDDYVAKLINCVGEPGARLKAALEKPAA